MSYTQYSFEDVSVTMSHWAIGQYVAKGAGIGSITLSMSTDRTTHDVSADGNTMISKVQGNNGTIALAIQQTSAFNKWLMKAYNAVDKKSPANWALFAIVIRSNNLKEQTTCLGVSFQKLPDKPYQAQGQQVTWQLMAGSIQQDVI